MKKPEIGNDEAEETKKMKIKSLNSTNQESVNNVIIYDESQTIRINEHETEFEITDNYNIRGKLADKKKLLSRVD